MAVVLEHWGLGEGPPQNALTRVPWLVPPWKVSKMTVVKSTTVVTEISIFDVVNEKARKECIGGRPEHQVNRCDFKLIPGDVIFEVYKAGESREEIWASGVPGKSPFVTLVAIRDDILAEPMGISTSGELAVKIVPKDQVIVIPPPPPPPPTNNKKLLWVLAAGGLLWGLS